MSMSVSGSSNAISYLQQLLQQGITGASSAASGADPLSQIMQALSGATSGADPLTSQTAPPSGSGSPGVSPFGSGTMAALISMQGQPPGGFSTSQMFSTFDSNGDGQISKAEFDSAFSQAGVDSETTNAAFAKLDANGDGSISESELAKAKHAHGHHHHHADADNDAQGTGQTSQNPLDLLLAGVGANGATTQSVSNPDGSSMTTISYADGSKVDMTTPASSSNSSDNSGNSGTSGNTGSQNAVNLLEQLIRMQSQMISMASPMLSTTA